MPLRQRQTAHQSEPNPRTILRVRNALVAFIISFTAIPTTVHASSIVDDFGGLAVHDHRFYNRLAKCETNRTWKHSTKSYTGGFGLYRRTAWRWSGMTDISHLTPRRQAEIVDRLAFTGWTNPKTGEYVWPVGPWGFGTVKHDCMGLQRFICKSPNKAVKRWCRKQ